MNSKRNIEHKCRNNDLCHNLGHINGTSKKHWKTDSCPLIKKAKRKSVFRQLESKNDSSESAYKTVTKTTSSMASILSSSKDDIEHNY
jgi:hypothetical protein